MEYQKTHEKLTKRAWFRVTPKTYEKLRKIAYSKDRTPAYIIRKLIEGYVEEQESTL